MLRSSLLAALSFLVFPLLGCASTNAAAEVAPPAGPAVEYLEIVTPDVDATCATYEVLHGVTFGEPVEALGGARTAPLAGGGRIGVRAPMHAGEAPALRAYLLVDDVQAAASAAMAAGGEPALPFMEIPGEGSISIFQQGGVFHALWQN